MASSSSESPCASNLFQLLQAACQPDPRRHRHIGKAGLPISDADFADVYVANRVQRDAVRRQEFAGLEAGTIVAQPGDALALGVDDGQARAEVGDLAIDGHAGAELADDEIRMLAAAAMQGAGPV